MRSIRIRIRAVLGNASGMTLIEVIIAIFLLAIVSTSAVALVVASMKSTATNQRGELAVTIANQAMEAASAQSAAVNPSTTVSYLYQGRQTSKVNTQWAAAVAAGVAGSTTTYRGSDPTATASSTAALPLSSVISRNGTNYTVTTLIGPCYQRLSGGNCALLGSHTYTATPPATTPTGYTALVRVIVVVSWTAGDSCRVTACTYTATSLVDAHDDLDWKIHD